MSVSAELLVAVVLETLWDLDFIDGTGGDGLGAVSVHAHRRVRVPLQDLRQGLGLIGQLLDLELVSGLQLLEYRSLEEL